MNQQQVMVPRKVEGSKSVNTPNQTSKPAIRSYRPVRTVLVDDSELMRHYLAFLIGRQSDLELVGTAADGRQALGMVDVLKPDLILMDVDMPRLNGFETTRVIKGTCIKAGYAPVIVMVTADDTLECRSRAADAGADGFVPKSSNLPDQLRSTLDDLFPRTCESLRANLIQTDYEN